MLKVLVKKQLFEIFRGYFYNAKENRMRSRGGSILCILLFALLLGGIGAMFAAMALTLCGPLSAAGMEWFYYALLAALALLLGVFGSVFNTYAGLYLARDNELLLSLPIPAGKLLLSRLVTVYLLGALYSGVVLMPGIVVFWLHIRHTAAAVVGGVSLWLVVSGWVLALSCGIGWLVAKISLRLRHKSFAVVALTLLLLGGYYVLCFQAQSLLAGLLTNAAEYGRRVQGAVYPLYLLGRAGCGVFSAMACVLLITAAVLGLLWLGMERSFFAILTASGREGKTPGAAVRCGKRRSVSRALLQKEWGRFTASPGYMLNCGMGAVFLMAGGAAILLKGRELLAQLAGAQVFPEEYMPVLLWAAVCLLAVMCDSAAPSVSLEGKRLWLVQSLPVTPWQVLRGKLTVQLLLTEAPMAFCLACAAAVGWCGGWRMALVALGALSYGWMQALFGLFYGLRFPNLSWTNELTPIKQSACTAFSILGGFVYVMAAAGLCLLLQRWLTVEGCLLLLCASTLAIGAVLLRWCKGRGAEIFADL